MYVFPDELRKAYESLMLPLAFFCAKDGRLVPLLVTDGLCALLRVDRERLVGHREGNAYDFLHPDDAGRVAMENHGSFRASETIRLQIAPCKSRIRR